MAINIQKIFGVRKGYKAEKYGNKEVTANNLNMESLN